MRDMPAEHRVLSALWKKKKKMYLYYFNYVYLCMGMCVLCAGVHRGQRCQISLVLEL